MNISKKLNNLCTLVIILILLLILMLVYLKTNRFELFDDIPTTTMATTTTVGITPDISEIHNSPLLNFINTYKKQMALKNEFTSTLVERQDTINSLTNKVTNLINPST